METILSKRKFIFPVIACILLFLCYKFAFSKTIESWKLKRGLEAELGKATGQSVQPDFLARTNVALNRLTKQYQLDSAVLRDAVLNKISLIAREEGIKIINIPSDDGNSVSRLSLQKLTLEGSFFKLLKVYHLLESSPGTGLVRSASFITQSRPNDISRPLNMTVYITSIKKY